ncbi:zinc ABC transporter substrate-binding protein [Cohnella lubricantis]|nr:zinc transport system substrate-binding protein [Cohnella lubricantis]
MYRKRWMLPLLVTVTAALLLAGCGSSGDNLQAKDGRVNVVTTFYPLYFMATQIGGEDVRVTNLIPTGVEPHDWTPKSRDLQEASQAQLFIYNGAGLEGWVDDFLHGVGSSSALKTVEASDGIQLIHGNPEHEEHAGEETEEHADEHDVDPHTWVSPKSALIMAENIYDAYVSIDPAHQADYDRNYQALKEKLEALDQQFTDGLAAVTKRDIVVSHQAFGYLSRDYGLNQVAIMGLAPDAEPRAQDLLDIAKFVKEKGVTTIFFEELVSDQLAKTLASEANVGTDVLNPLEGLTPKQEKAGDDYFTIMQRNLQNLRKALQ